MNPLDSIGIVPGEVPRPLKPGEFFCHLCLKVVPLKDCSEHYKEHRRA